MNEIVIPVIEPLVLEEESAIVSETDVAPHSSDDEAGGGGMNINMSGNMTMGNTSMLGGAGLASLQVCILNRTVFSIGLYSYCILNDSTYCVLNSSLFSLVLYATLSQKYYVSCLYMLC